MAGTDVLVWLDMEMTGLDPDRERIIEIATILTDGNLTEIAVGPELVIHQDEPVLAAMDDWNKSHHGGAGLGEAVGAATGHQGDGHALAAPLIEAHVPAQESPGCPRQTVP